jgi:hypothetical protein
MITQWFRRFVRSSDKCVIRSILHAVYSAHGLRSGPDMLNVSRQPAEAWCGFLFCLSSLLKFMTSMLKVFNHVEIMRRAMSDIQHLGRREGEIIHRRPYVVNSFATDLFT